MTQARTVLVVDQDPDARYQVQGLVQQAGFAVAGQAGLGTEAVALAAAERPDAVVCGLREPMARALHTVESLTGAAPEAPIVAYASVADLDIVRKAMQSGARDFLRAPFGKEELRRSLAEALASGERRRAREQGQTPALGVVMTVFGAKGGVGKTTLATNLAVALVTQAGQDVVLVDADDTFGDAAESLALAKGRAVTDALREAAGAEPAELRRYVGYHESGLAVLAAPPDPFEWRGVPAESLHALLGGLARQFDIVLVDTGSTLSDVTLAALTTASQVLWVTTPEYASVHDSLQALRAVRGAGVPDEHIRLVLNAASAEAEVRPSSVEEALGLRVFWTVPYDRLLRRGMQLGQPVVSGGSSAAAAGISELALVLSGWAPKPEPEGLLRRLLAGRQAPTRRLAVRKA